MSDLVYSIVMLGAVAMLAGAWYLYRRLGPNRQSMLMVILAVVMLGNVVIWSIPDGSAPAEGVSADAAAQGSATP
ncbi:hypothetical protein [Alteraurantiacibacter palmitatis]|uniref:Uncharacterized protein n=2 Tax=Alteraurantiacibacter palmitatis TaxID=2054628 RepID=A0ABV7E3S3_9SPHN